MAGLIIRGMGIPARERGKIKILHKFAASAGISVILFSPMHESNSSINFQSYRRLSAFQ